MWIKILCIEYILWGIPTIESTFDVANMVKTATVKDVPINNDALLNRQVFMFGKMVSAPLFGSSPNIRLSSPNFHYNKTSSISRTKSQNLNVSCLLLQWSLSNPLKPGVKMRMKM